MSRARRLRLAMRAAVVVGLIVGAMGWWLAAASAVWCMGTRMPFSLFAWWDALAIWRANWWVNVWLILGGVIPTLVTVPLLGLLAQSLLRYRSTRRLTMPAGGALKPTERGVTDNHGHAAWANERDLTRDLIGPGNLIGAVTRGGKLLFDDVRTGPTHCLQIAGPGSFKTMTAITRLWYWHGPRVAFDPSMEIGPIMTEALKTAGCRVVTIGLNGSGLNALDWIDVRHPEADAHIRTVVNWIYNEGAGAIQAQNRDPSWPTQGRSLVTCLLAHLLHNPPEGVVPSLKALRRGIATPEADMQDLMAYIHAHSPSRMAAELAGGFKDMKAVPTFSGIFSNAFSATEWLSVEAYADAVSGDAMKTSDVLSSKTVVFVQLPLRSVLTTPAIARAVMGALFNAMFHADSGEGDRILFQLDEAWLLGAMPEIKLCHTTARKYRGTIASIWQSEGQLDGVWGRDDAKMIRDTVSWRSFNAVGDGDVADKLSRDLGEHGVMAHSEGDNTGRQKPFGLALPSSSRGSNVNTHEIKRRLIKGDEILRAPADQMFVLKRNYPKPIKCFAAPFFDFPSLKARLGASRFRPAA